MDCFARHHPTHPSSHTTAMLHTHSAHPTCNPALHPRLPLPTARRATAEVSTATPSIPANRGSRPPVWMLTGLLGLLGLVPHMARAGSNISWSIGINLPADGHGHHQRAPVVVHSTPLYPAPVYVRPAYPVPAYPVQAYPVQVYPAPVYVLPYPVHEGGHRYVTPEPVYRSPRHVYPVPPVTYVTPAPKYRHSGPPHSFAPHSFPPHTWHGRGPQGREMYPALPGHRLAPHTPTNPHGHFHGHQHDGMRR
jgi:hypothetical protein